MKKRTGRVKRVSLLLTLAILLGCFSTYVFAVETEDALLGSETVVSLPGDTVEAETLIENSVMLGDEEIGAVAEVASLRTADTKHFRLDNGTYTAVRYAAAVHRQDANGVWQDIDNRLIRNETSDGAVYSTPDSRVTLAAGYTPGEQLLTISENGYTVSMGMMGNTAPGNGNISTETQPLDKWASPTVVAGAARPASMKYDTIDEAMSFNGSSSITYNEVRANTNLEYQLHGNTVKENIIVSARADAYEYTFALYLDGLTATAEEDGSISLKDAVTGEAKYTIPAPYMYDAIGEDSRAVAYELAQVKTGLYLLNVTADPTWINAEERVFPVTIDPTIQANEGFEIFDSYTSSDNPNTNYGSATQMYVDESCSAYVRVEMPEIPPDATVNKTFLFMPYYYTVTSGSMEIGVYKVTGFWGEMNITHNNAPQVDTTCLSSRTFTVSSSYTVENPGMARFAIHAAAQSWYSGATNVGVVFKQLSGTAPMVFHSHESGGIDRLIVAVSYTYYVPDGVYALENVANKDRWMRVESDSTVAGSHIQQSSWSSCPASSTVFRRTGLFKISRVPDTDQYIIRSMLNNNLGLSVSGTQIVTKPIPSNDSDVEMEDTFHIEWLGSGFGIRPYGTTVVLHMTSTSEANLTTIEKENATTSSQWSLYMYGGMHRLSGEGDMDSWTRNGVVVGTEVQTRFIAWSTYINANTQQVEIVSGYRDIAVASWNASTETFTLTPGCPGTISIRTRILYGETATVAWQGYYTVVIMPREGTYCIQNAGTEKYIYMPGPGSSSMQQWEFVDDVSEQWIVEHVPGSNGYVRLKSAYSNRYLGVDSSDSTRIWHYVAGDDDTLWKIERTDNGHYKFTCKATESSGMALAVPLTENANGTNLTQLAYANDGNYRDEWSIIRWPYIQLEAQETYWWCWVASARMSSMSRAQSDVSQAMAAVYVKLHVETDEPTQCQINEAKDGGTMEEIKEAVEYILSSSDLCHWGYYCIYSEATLRSLLDDSNPVVIGRGWYDDSGNTTEGHAIVVYDYHWNSEHGIFVYDIFDPSPVNQGASYSKSYANLCIGRVEGFIGEETDYGMWAGVVAYKIGDYQNTIPSPAYV